MRITRVASARKDQGTCGACGEPINKGMAYKHFSFRYGGKRKRHEACAEWRPSELTSNDKLSAIYAAQESADDSFAALTLPTAPADAESFADEVKSVLSDCADAIQEVAEMYREMATNIEEGFQHPTEQSEEAESNGDMVESWAEEMVGYEPDAFDTESEEAVDDWAEAVLEEAQALTGECPL